MCVCAFASASNRSSTSRSLVRSPLLSIWRGPPLFQPTTEREGGGLFSATLPYSQKQIYRYYYYKAHYPQILKWSLLLTVRRKLNLSRLLSEEALVLHSACFFGRNLFLAIFLSIDRCHVGTLKGFTEGGISKVERSMYHTCYYATAVVFTGSCCCYLHRHRTDRYGKTDSKYTLEGEKGMMSSFSFSAAASS